jgi:beta-N-acetylhexosaminidase
VLDRLRSWPRGVFVLLVLGTALVAAAGLGLFVLSGGEGAKRATSVGTTPNRDPSHIELKQPETAHDQTIDLKQQGTAHDRPSAPPHSAPPRGLAAMVGQRLTVGIFGTTPSPALLDYVREGMVGGVVLFPASGERSLLPNAARTAVARLQEAAKEGSNPPLLVAIDQEGGAVKRLPGPPTLAPPAVSSPVEAQRQGLATGHFLNGLGINVDLAPVLDLGLPGSFVAQQGRTFSSDPGKDAAVGNGFATGLIDSGVAATAKHFPGLGHANANTDTGRSVVERVGNHDLIPFQQAIRFQPADRLLVMLSTAIYPAYDGRNPGAWSPTIINGLLRERLDFDGVVITDDLSSPGVKSMMSTPDATVAAAKAGADEMLISAQPDELRPAYAALLAAARSGQLQQTSLRAANQRIQRLKHAIAR